MTNKNPELYNSLSHIPRHARELETLYGISHVLASGKQQKRGLAEVLAALMWNLE